VTLDELGDFWINLVVGFGRRIESILATDNGTSPLGGSWALLAGRYHQLSQGIFFWILGGGREIMADIAKKFSGLMLLRIQRFWEHHRNAI
jgi:hypothetical protein